MVNRNETMKNILKKKKTKRAILAAIEEILKARGSTVTLPRISKIVGLTVRTLKDSYFDFIRDNSKGKLYQRKQNGISIEAVEKNGLIEKLKNINPDLSDKAWGIGLEDHNTYRR